MRIAVLGAGIIGVATAYELAADGHEVTVFDRCSSVAAETTITLSNAALPPVSNSKGMSNRSAGAVPCSTMNRVRS